MRAGTTSADHLSRLVVVGRPQRDVAPHVLRGRHRRSTAGGDRSVVEPPFRTRCPPSAWPRITGRPNRPALSGRAAPCARRLGLYKREAAPGCATSRNPGAVAQKRSGPRRSERPGPDHHYPAAGCLQTRVSCAAAGVRYARSPSGRVRPGPALFHSQRTWTLVSVAPAGKVGEQRLAAIRKVHHPKIVQRSDGLWLVACPDCRRAGESATPDGDQLSRRLVRGGATPLGGPL